MENRPRAQTMEKEAAHPARTHTRNKTRPRIPQRGAAKRARGLRKASVDQLENKEGLVRARAGQRRAAAASANGRNMKKKEQENPMTLAILNTYQAIPHARADALDITALVRYRGQVVGYRLSDGAIVSKPDAVALAKRGGIAGVGIGARKGTEYLKALPDRRDGNNLSSLPSISPPG